MRHVWSHHWDKIDSAVLSRTMQDWRGGRDFEPKPQPSHASVETVTDPCKDRSNPALRALKAASKHDGLEFSGSRRHDFEQSLKKMKPKTTRRVSALQQGSPTDSAIAMSTAQWAILTPHVQDTPRLALAFIEKNPHTTLSILMPSDLVHEIERARENMS